MDKDVQAKLPRHFKDDTGYCYAATEQLAREPGLTPWNGEVNGKGFAVEPTETDKAAAKASKSAAKSNSAK